jgi:hypothetical protein
MYITEESIAQGSDRKTSLLRSRRDQPVDPLFAALATFADAALCPHVFARSRSPAASANRFKFPGESPPVNPSCQIRES